MREMRLFHMTDLLDKISEEKKNYAFRKLLLRYRSVGILVEHVFDGLQRRNYSRLPSRNQIMPRAVFELRKFIYCCRKNRECQRMQQTLAENHFKGPL